MIAVEFYYAGNLNLDKTLIKGKVKLLYYQQNVSDPIFEEISPLYGKGINKTQINCLKRSCFELY